MQAGIVINPAQKFTTPVRVEPVETRPSTSSGRTVFNGRLSKEDFPKVHDWPPQVGVFFSAEHVKRYAQVVVLGQTAAKNLFPNDMNPLGQYALIGNAPFLVIGVLTSKGLSSRGDDMDNSAWLPYTTAGARVFGQRFFNN